MIRLEVLGAIRVWHGRALVELGGPRRRDLLAVLHLHATEPVAVDRLASLLWAGRPPRTGIRTLRSHVSHLRALFDGVPVIETTPGGYRLSGETDSDAEQFERTLADARTCRSEEPERAWELYGDGLALLRGPAYADVQLDLPELDGERHRLDTLGREAQRERVALGLQLGYHRELLPELGSLVARHPFDEVLAQQYASSLYGQGRQKDALGSLQRLRVNLRDELGLEPTEGTRNLEVAILRHELPGVQPTPTPPRTVRVPVPVGRTVGRQADIERLSDLIRAVVTLVGTGGVGKTRLAQEVAHRAVVHEFRHGAVFVDLTAVRDGKAVVEHLAAALGIGEQAGRSTRQGIEEHLRPREVLLLTDNCEHIIEPVADIIAWLAGIGPGVHVLATSRTRLALPGETVIPVSPLDTGDDVSPDGGAVELFLEAARRRESGFHADGADLALIGDICRRLDGLPLAIELAAARCGASDLQAISGLLDDPVRGLVGGLRPRDPRHRSLEATIRWSYDALNDRQQAVLRAVSIFAGSFDAEAAEAVCDPLGCAEDIRRHLEDLVDVSLVTVRSNGDGARYSLLETIRAFGRRELELFDGTQAAADAHLRHHLELARSARFWLVMDSSWFDRLELVLPDLRTAFHHGCDTSQARLAVPMAVALAFFMSCRHFNEGRAWIDAALGLADSYEDEVDPRARAGALAARGYYAAVGNDPDEGRLQLAAAIDRYRGSPDAGRLCTAGLLWALYWASFHPPGDDPWVSHAQANEALALARELDEPVSIFHMSIRRAESMVVAALRTRGDLAPEERRTLRQDVETALTAAEEKLGSATDGFAGDIAKILLGVVQVLDGEVDTGLGLAEGAVLRLHRHRLGTLASGRLISVGQLAIASGRQLRGRELTRLGLEWLVDTGFAPPARAALFSVARLSLPRRPATATALLTAAQRLIHDLHSHYLFLREDDVEHAARTALDPSERAQAQAVGEAMTREQALSLALAQLTPSETAATKVAALSREPALRLVRK